MRLILASAFATLLISAGCVQAVPEQAGSSTATTTSTPNATPGAAPSQPTANDNQAVSEPTPVPISNGAIELTPDNTKIEFVGLHLPPKQPDPRTGGFEKFTGKIQVDPTTKALKSITVDIDTTSIWTQIDRLTNHLKSADFFEVNEYPTAKFESTRIEPATGEEGRVLVTGNLTLHSVTKETSFPATVAITDAGLTLRTSFAINRLDWDIKYRPDQVEKIVTLNVVVGEKTQPQRGGGGFGGKGGKRKKSPDAAKSPEASKSPDAAQPSEGTKSPSGDK
jgi:polyisoprenoid-binding protein YceI